MTTAHARVADAFDRLRAAPPPERERILLADPSLTDPERAQVRELLAHDSPTEYFLGQPVQRVAAGLLEPLVETPAPALIGRYRILRQIARGSFGSVFLARQSNPERDVAIKLLPPGADDAARRRFEFEAAALARLNHPNVTAVLELAYDADRPYIVMEYVDGIPLDAYAARHALAPEDRIALIRQVCDGVAHIHQRGVLHRDLAPKNILVTPEGVPKIVDFGLACDAASDLHAAQRLTLPGSIIGTLRYISPEQLAGLPADERSDAYALGVITFELLCGKHPYLANDSNLSDAITQLQHATLNLPTRTPASFESDLHAVLAMAVERAPARRYPGPAALADDLRRLLEHLPVSALPAGILYRLRKLYARKKRATWVAAAFLAVVTVLACNAAASIRREARNRDAALHALDAVVTRLLSPLAPRIGTLEDRERLLAAIESDVLSMEPLASRDIRVLKVYAGLRTAQSDAHRDRARNDLSLAAAEQAVDAWEVLWHLTDQDPQIGHEFSIALVKNGDALARVGRPADTHYRNALRIDEFLARQHPSDLAQLSNLYWSQTRVAECCARSAKEAAAFLASADETAARMISLAPDDWRSLDAFVQACIYRARAQGRSTPAAVAALVMAEKAAARLIELDPVTTVHQSAYLRVLSNLLAAHGADGPSLDLQPYVDRALAIERTLAANSGQTRYEDPDLIAFFDQLSRVSFETGRPAEALPQADKAVAYAARRMAGGTGSPQDALKQADILCARKLPALLATGAPHAHQDMAAALEQLRTDVTKRFGQSPEAQAAADELRTRRDALLTASNPATPEQPP